MAEDRNHHVGDCHDEHEAIMAEIRYHVHEEIIQLADVVIGPTLYGGERDTSVGLKAEQEQIKKDVQEIRDQLNNGIKFRLDWKAWSAIIGALLAMVGSIIIAIIETHP